MQVHRNRPRRRIRPVVAGFVGLLVMVAAAFGGALLWQTAQEARARLENPSPEAADEPLSAAVAGSVSAPAENAGASAISESSHADTVSAAENALLRV